MPIALTLALLATPAPAATAAASCTGRPGYDRLDFWIGEWDVFVGRQLAGVNRIEKILDGCAVMEFWEGAGGAEGRSLFYHDPAAGTWKQVWVTSNATAPGGLKEKTLIATENDGSLRFQGTIALADGRTYLDRTTLRPLEDGRVRQLIEISTDDGATWRPTFDGMYVRRAHRDASADTSAARARRLLERALAHIGGADAIARAGGLVLTGQGSWDIGVRLQGMAPFRSEPRPLVERIAIDPRTGHTVYETRGAINPDAEEWLRYDHRANASYIVDLLSRRAFQGDAAARPRTERMVPHRLLAEALAADSALRLVGDPHAPAASYRSVRWTTPGGTVLTLGFDAADRLDAVAWVADVPVRGTVDVVWRFSDYRSVPGLGLYPGRYAIAIDGQVVRSLEWTSIAAGARSDLFDSLPDIAYPEPRTQTPAPAQPPAGDSFDIRELDPGVFLLINVRPGFHVLFVEFDDFVLAVDAPAGWLELQELPADIAPAGAPTAVGDRYLRAIRSRIPDKPIRYVVLTHHHDDHAGGVAPFVAAGATVLGTAVTRPVVEAAAGASAPFETVETERTIRDASMEVRILHVGPNPHADGMLAVHLPRHRLLYVSDLFEPASDPFFPSPARLPVMRWFVDWLDRSGLDVDRIYAVHGRALVTPEQLEHIRRLPPPR